MSRRRRCRRAGTRDERAKTGDPITRRTGWTRKSSISHCESDQGFFCQLDLLTRIVASPLLKLSRKRDGNDSHQYRNDEQHDRNFDQAESILLWLEGLAHGANTEMLSLRVDDVAVSEFENMQVVPALWFGTSK